MALGETPALPGLSHDRISKSTGTMVSSVASGGRRDAKCREIGAGDSGSYIGGGGGGPPLLAVVEEVGDVRAATVCPLSTLLEMTVPEIGL